MAEVKMMTLHELDLQYNLLKENLKKHIPEEVFHEAWTRTIRQMGKHLSKERDNYGREFA